MGSRAGEGLGQCAVPELRQQFGISTREVPAASNRIPNNVPRETQSYTTVNVARRLGVSLQTVQRWVDSGILTGWKTPGGHRRIDVASAERLFDAGRPRAAPVVVVIDDKPTARARLVALIRQALPGAEVAAVEDGFQGLVAIGRVDPDIVVTDVPLPHMDGFEMLRSLIGEPAPKPRAFIAVTALTEPELAALGPFPSNVLLLKKPPGPKHFIAALQVRASGRQVADDLASEPPGPERRKSRGRHVQKSE